MLTVRSWSSASAEAEGNAPRHQERPAEPLTTASQRPPIEDDDDLDGADEPLY